MRFAYLRRSSRVPVLTLRGARVRFLPVCPVAVIHQTISCLRDGLVDTAASDTVFPLTIARSLGIDLAQAPTGQSRQAGGAVLSYRYASVRLSLSDGLETCEWDAIVGFLDSPTMHRPLLGQAGFLEFFDAALLGSRHEVVITPNASFPGRHIIH